MKAILQFWASTVQHTHMCPSKFHEGPRSRPCYDTGCTEPKQDACWPCHDLELEADGATWESAAGDVSDADPGL